MIKTIYILWFQGFDNAPLIIKKCLESWKYHNSDWNIIELDNKTLYYLFSTLKKTEDINDNIKIINDNRMQKILLISPGGCACTAFIEFLKDYVKINCRHDTDHLKHTLPWDPMVTKYNPTHIIYLYGDFDKAIRSLFRRGFHKYQYHKLKNIRSSGSIPTPFNNFRQYIKLVLNSRTEPFGILDHYKAWKAVPGVFFIHYENIPTSQELDTFLGIPQGTCSKFPIKERTSEKNIHESEQYLNIMKQFMKEVV